MAKKVLGQIKLELPAAEAKPSPPVGPALGARGLNIMMFVKEFNAQTAQMEKGSPVPVVITYYQDKSFTLEFKTPPASFLIKKAIKLQAGSKKPGRDKVGVITMAQCRDIAKIKMKDLNAVDIEAGARVIAGSARSMGVDVTGE
jgi:large subunit ribosomal protein L11